MQTLFVREQVLYIRPSSSSFLVKKQSHRWLFHRQLMSKKWRNWLWSGNTTHWATWTFTPGPPATVSSAHWMSWARKGRINKVYSNSTKPKECIINDPLYEKAQVRPSRSLRKLSSLSINHQQTPKCFYYPKIIASRVMNLTQVLAYLIRTISWTPLLSQASSVVRRVSHVDSPKKRKETSLSK